MIVSRKAKKNCINVTTELVIYTYHRSQIHKHSSHHENYCLVITDAVLYYIESNGGNQRPFLSTSHCELYSVVRAPTPDESSLLTQPTRYSRISTFFRINNLKFIEIGSASLLIWPYIVLPFTKTFYTAVCFIFIAHFLWACVNPRSFIFQFSFVHSLVCLITHLFLHGF